MLHGATRPGRSDRALALLLVSLITLTSAAAQSPHPKVQLHDGQTRLIAPDGRAIHATHRSLDGFQFIAQPAMNIELALWSEIDDTGLRSQWYAVATHGGPFSFTAANRHEIELRYARFDPLAGPPAVAPLLAAGPTTQVYLVQFITPPLEPYRDAVRAAGGTVLGFMPYNSHIVRMSADAAAVVAGLPVVRWVGPYQPAYKLEEALLDELLDDAAAMPARRYSIMMHERGPLAQDAVANRLTALGAIVHTRIPQGFRIEATLTGPQLLALVHMDEVHFVDRWSPPEEDMDLARQIGGAVPILSSAGFTGQGVRGEVMDGGLRITHAGFASPAPLLHGPNTTNTGHGTNTYGCVFGNGASNAAGTGMLPDREQGIFAAYSTLSNRYIHTQELVDPNGPYRAVFQSNSWGSTQTTSYTTISAEMDDILFLYDILVCQSQSNLGTQSSRPQAWAKNIVSVGGIRHNNTLSRFDDSWGGGASIGPASDGRIKPDLAHFYDAVTCTSSASDTAYTTSFGGTSAATPITAGHFGLLCQMWHAGVFAGFGGEATVFDSRPHMTTAKALMINAAYRYDFSAPGDDLSRYKQGWGMADLGRLYDERDAIFVVNETDLLAPLDVNQYTVSLTGTEPELAVTLVYADPMGSPASSVHRINDLSLRVTSPTGVTYWGNNGLTSGNVSVPGGAANTKDTVENVFIPAPAAGTWQIEVLGAEIVEDSHVETPETDADYALVVRGGALIPPPLTIALIERPADLEPPGAAPTVVVRIQPGTEQIVAGSELLWWRYSSDSFSSIQLSPTGDGFYEAALPALACGDAPEFYVSALGDQGSSVTLPAGAPDSSFAFSVGTLEVLVEDTFETDSGWTVTNQSLTTGAWVRAIPIPPTRTAEPPGDFDGSGRCWLTGNTANEDVDGGPTILTSSQFSLAGLVDPTISYARWMSTNATNGADNLNIHISADDGATWEPVESIDLATWTELSFRPADLVPLTPTMRLRFMIQDQPNGSVTEAAIDYLRVIDRRCDGGCAGDLDGDGDTDFDDLTTLLAAYGVGPEGDVDGDGDTDFDDLVAVLSSYGCAGG